MRLNEGGAYCVKLLALFAEGRWASGQVHAIVLIGLPKDNNRLVYSAVCAL
jgi:hypothetical protein